MLFYFFTIIWTLPNYLLITETIIGGVVIRYINKRKKQFRIVKCDSPELFWLCNT